MTGYDTFAAACDLHLADLLREPDTGAIEAVFPASGFAAARRRITSWTGYVPTPLVPLPGAAETAGVAEILYKDESRRFDQASFKVLGGAFAVQHLLAERVKRETGISDISAADLEGGAYRHITQKVVVACATDGNHGRSVAWGAKRFGCRCVIFLHEKVSGARSAAIAACGAEIRRVPGNYDDSVRAAAEEAERNGWIVVSDTSYPGYAEIPKLVMQGYRVMVQEVLHALAGRPLPTHVFVQGGVGGLAAAVAAHFRQAGHKPCFVMVEPINAACLLASAERGEPTTVSGVLETIMAGLSCGEVSHLAWPVVRDSFSAYATLPDEAAEQAMRDLADGCLIDWAYGGPKPAGVPEPAHGTEPVLTAAE